MRRTLLTVIGKETCDYKHSMLEHYYKMTIIIAWAALVSRSALGNRRIWTRINILSPIMFEADFLK
jgi:hypothetical protein